jgi:hypothetical protein
VGHAVRAVEPGSAHWASLGLPLSVHQVINDDPAIRLGEETVRTGASLRKMAAQLSDAFPLAHEFDFREAKLFALG